MSSHDSRCENRIVPTSRRDFLFKTGAGFGALAFAGLSSTARGKEGIGPHFAPKAKNVIWLFMDGGPSHLDLFDPKPALTKYAGSPLPAGIVRPQTSMGTSDSPLLASTRTFKQRGQAGLWVSDLYPAIANHVDDLCVIRSCKADALTHVAAVTQMHSGSLLLGKPSLGVWTMYGLGAETDNLPAFIVLADESGDPPGGPSNWGPGFMPASYQGTRLGIGKDPVLYLKPATEFGPQRERGRREILRKLNERHRETRPLDDRLEAKIAAHEMAFRMQVAAPEALSVENETEATQKMYGMDRPESASAGRNCLLARRLVERGVRFVQLYFGVGSQWDAHSEVDANHQKLCRQSDMPIAGLLTDLKQRGLLESTLVIWGGEFGRSPMSESGNGRDHNPMGFTMWMAGGGSRPGHVVGSTDDFGLYAQENPVHIHDLHATILHLLGLDHERLTYLHSGRDERLTGTEGKVIQEILA